MRSFSDSLLARVLRRQAQAVCRHPKWFVYPQILLALAGVLYTAADLRLDMDRDHLIGRRLAAHRIYLRFRKEFPRQDELVVVVESGNQQRNRQFVERLAAKIRPQTNLFVDLFYKADPTTLGPKALLLVPTKDLKDMKAALAEYLPEIQQFGEATNLNSLFELVNRQFRTAVPEQNRQTSALIHSLPMLAKIIAEGTQSMLRPGRPPPPGVDTMLSGGAEAQNEIYVTLDGGRLYLLTVRPRSEAVTPEAILAMRRALAQTRIEAPGVDAGLTGGPVLDYDEMKQAEHDSIQASIAALVICSLIFIIAYREVTRPLKAVLVSGLTAMTSFGTLILAQHRGIRSLGEVMSVGIAACMVAGLTFLPAVLCLIARTGWTVPMRVGRSPAATRAGASQRGTGDAGAGLECRT